MYRVERTDDPNDHLRYPAVGSSSVQTAVEQVSGLCQETCHGEGLQSNVKAHLGETVFSSAN